MNLKMKKIILIILLLFSYLGKTQNLPELYNDVKSSVVIIKILSIDAERSGDNQLLVTSAKQGSGVLVSKEGLIWTAAHVVQSAEIVGVEFLDGDIYEAEVLSTNPMADVALIKIKDTFKLKEKKVVVIGDSDKINIGEDVFVIGAPFGLKQSLSRGILSGKHTLDSINNSFSSVEFLQTDAAINTGNSGGPMFNMKGEVVGISSRIYSHLGEFNGIGFAVSSNIAKKLLMEESNIWTGMESLLIVGDLAKALNLPQESGLLVLSMSSKGIAAKLGLQAGTIPVIINDVEIVIGGDIILDFAGIKIEDVNFPAMAKKKIKAYHKGDKIPIRFLRNGKVEVIQYIKE